VPSNQPFKPFAPYGRSRKSPDSLRSSGLCSDRLAAPQTFGLASPNRSCQSVKATFAALRLLFGSPVRSQARSAGGNFQLHRKSSRPDRPRNKPAPRSSLPPSSARCARYVGRSLVARRSGYQLLSSTPLSMRTLTKNNI